MRFSRHCYDKPHRCPGWAGGGTHSAKIKRCPNGGYINVNYEDRWYKWKFHHCTDCTVTCWPIVIQELDYGWWGWRVERLGNKAEEHVLWPLQKAVVLGLYTRPLRFGATALKLDQRWKTRVWEKT